MRWKAIGHSVAGASHLAAGKSCEDSLQYAVVTDPEDREVLVVCASDGAGSARHAALASEYATVKALEMLTGYAITGHDVHDSDVYGMAQDIYDGLSVIAKLEDAELAEYSCTLLGGIITPTRSVFFQVGDGAIVIREGDHFLPVWWPFNGEYQNTTSFIVDDPNVSKLNVIIHHEQIKEIAIFTDGLQMLALNNEQRDAHQPFFHDLFPSLRQADKPEKTVILNNKLADYLAGNAIRSRTDDDVTLFLGSVLEPE